LLQSTFLGEGPRNRHQAIGGRENIQQRAPNIQLVVNKGFAKTQRIGLAEQAAHNAG
jgi:hypothetical protein